jgi:hypothetical protein
MAYKPSSPEQGGGLSVLLEYLVANSEAEIIESIRDPQYIAAVVLTVEDVRALADEAGDPLFQVGYSPLPDNCAHCDVWGKFTKSGQKRLSRLANWFIEINGVETAIG